MKTKVSLEKVIEIRDAAEKAYNKHVPDFAFVLTYSTELQELANTFYQVAKRKHWLKARLSTNRHNVH